MLMHNKLDMGHARALVGLDPAQQVLLANKVVQQGLSVRETERLVKKTGQDAKSNNYKPSVNHDIAALQDTLSEKLGAGVTIAAKAMGQVP